MKFVGLCLHFRNTWLPSEDIIRVSVSKCSKHSQNFRLLHPARGYSEILCLTQLVRWSPFRRQHSMLCDLNSANTVRLHVWLKLPLCGVNEIFALVGCYAGLIDSYLPTFWGNLSAPSSKVKQHKALEDGTDLSTPVLSTSNLESRGLRVDASCFLTLSKSVAIDVTLFEVPFQTYLENFFEWLQ